MGIIFNFSLNAQTRVLINTGFELPVQASNSLIFHPQAEVPGWTTTDIFGQIETWSTTFQGVSAEEGNQFVELNANSFGRLSQNICMLTGETFQWSFWHRARNVPGVVTTNNNIDSMRLIIDGVEQGRFGTGLTWTNYTGSYTLVGPSRTVTFSFEAVYSSSGSSTIGNFLDNIVITGLKGFPAFDPAGLSGVESLTNPQFKVLIDGTITTASTVKVAVTGGTATNGVDYLFSSPYIINVPPGNYDGTSNTGILIPLTIINDALVEGDETISFSIEGVTGDLAFITNACTPVPIASNYTIIDDDCPGQHTTACLQSSVTLTSNYNSPNVVNWYSKNQTTQLKGNSSTYTYTPTVLPDTLYAEELWTSPGAATVYSNTQGTSLQYSVSWNGDKDKTMMFNASQDFLLESFQIDANSATGCTGTTSSYTFALYKGGVATGQSYTFNCPCSGNGTTPSFKTVPVNWMITTGTNYEIRETAGDNLMVYQQWWPNRSWPISVNDASGKPLASFTGSPQSTSSGAFFNWNMKTLGRSCRSQFIIDPASFTKPILSVSANPICSGSSSLVNVTNASAGNVYTWTVTGAQSFTNPSASSLNVVGGSNASIQVKLHTQSGGCFSDTTFTIRVDQVTAPITAPVSYCQNASAVALAATASAGNTLLWYTQASGGTGNSTAPIPSTSAAGVTTYYVSQVNTNGCESARSSLVVTINALPQKPAGTDVSYCLNASTTALSASGTGLLWYTTSTGGVGNSAAPTPSSSSTGTLTFYVSQTVNGCEGPRDTVTVMVNPLPVPVIVNPVLSVCPQSTQLYSSEVHNGSVYQWTISSGSIASLNVLSSGTQAQLTFSNQNVGLTLQETDLNGCKASTLANISIINSSIPIIAGKTPICVEETSTYTIANPSGTYVWQLTNQSGAASVNTQTATTIDLSMNAAGTVKLLTIQTFNGCTVKDSLIIEIKALPVLVTNNTDQICEKDNALTLQATPAGGLFSGTGVTGGQFNPSAAGILSGGYNVFTYSYTDALGCNNQVKDSIKVNPNPPVTLSIDQPIVCAGSNAILTVSPVLPGASYEWHQGALVIGSNMTTYSTGLAGTYSVIATLNGCSTLSNNTTLEISNVSINAEGPYITRDLSLTITPSYTSSPSNLPLTFTWSSLPANQIIGNTLSLTVTPTKDTSYYQVMIENSLGCKAVSQTMVVLRHPILIPHIFSPNGDGMNEIWSIKYIEGYPQSLVTVYNRWGSVVYRKNHYLNDWDGTINGGELPVGTYYFVVELNDKEFKDPYTGSVTIIR